MPPEIKFIDYVFFYISLLTILLVYSWWRTKHMTLVMVTKIIGISLIVLLFVYYSSKIETKKKPKAESFATNNIERLSERKAKYNKVLISLEIEERQSLFVLLCADGTVNRLGTGDANNNENDMFIGIFKDGLFEKFIAQVPDSIFRQQPGSYDIPNKQGSRCKLSILFGTNSEAETFGFDFHYGSDSQGLPPEIAHIVTTAIEITENWYAEQKKMTGKSK